MIGFLIFFAVACYFSAWAGYYAAEWEDTPKGGKTVPALLFLFYVVASLTELGVALHYAWETVPR